MRENLVIFGGAARDISSYKNLISLAPENWKVFFVEDKVLIPSGKTDELSENVLKYLKENKIEQFNLLGHSIGGALALEFASMYSEFIKKIFLVDSEGIYGKENALKATWNWILTQIHTKGELTTSMLRVIGVLKNPFLHLRLAKYAHRANLKEQATKIKVPTTIIWGEKDHLTPLWQGEELNRLIKGSKLIVLKNSYHNWILNNPENFWDIVK